MHHRQTPSPRHIGAVLVILAAASTGTARATTHEGGRAERLAPVPSENPADASPIPVAGTWFWWGEARADRELPAAAEPDEHIPARRIRAFTFEADANPALGQTLFYVRAAQPLDLPCAVEIRDAGGRLVRRLDGAMARGSALFVWDGCETGGQKALPGAYFAKLDEGDALSRNDIAR